MRLPVNRLRGCTYDARTPCRSETLRPCRHAGTGRRVKPLARGRSRSGLAGRRSAAPALIDFDRPSALRPRPHMEIRRRPSQVPHCAHVPPPAALIRLFRQVTPFGVVCLATYAIFVGSMIIATIAR